MLTLSLVAAVLACVAASPWKSDPWPAASQQRSVAAPGNGGVRPAASQQRPVNRGPEDFWWAQPGANPFGDSAGHSSRPSGAQGHRAPVQRPQLGVSAGRPAPARAIISVSSSGNGPPRVTGARRVSAAVSGGSGGGSSRYIPPAAGSQPQPWTQKRQQPLPRPRPVNRPPTQTAFASASSPSRHQTSVNSVSSGSYSPPNSGSYSAPNSGSYSPPNSGSYSPPRVSSQPQHQRFTPGQLGGSGSGPVQNQYAGSSGGSSTGAQSPVVKSCGASLFCVDTNACDPYTGFLMDPSQGPIPQLDQPTVAFTRCYMSKSRSVGVCCQEPHINDPWTDRTTNGR